MIDAKALKKIASACRKAGIKSYKCAEFEFVLTDDAPMSQYKQSGHKVSQSDGSTKVDDIASESLTETELLFWSSTGQDEMRN